MILIFSFSLDFNSTNCLKRNQISQLLHNINITNININIINNNSIIIILIQFSFSIYNV
eukprot:UN03313